MAYASPSSMKTQCVPRREPGNETYFRNRKIIFLSLIFLSLIFLSLIFLSLIFLSLIFLSLIASEVLWALDEATSLGNCSDFAAVARSKGSPDDQIGAIAEKLHRAITHRSIHAPGMHAASCHDRVFSGRIGDRAPRPTVEAAPIGTDDMVVHRARIEPERPSVGKITSIQPPSGRIEVKI